MAGVCVCVVKHVAITRSAGSMLRGAYYYYYIYSVYYDDDDDDDENYGARGAAAAVHIGRRRRRYERRTVARRDCGSRDKTAGCVRGDGACAGKWQRRRRRRCAVRSAADVCGPAGKRGAGG